MTVTRHERHTPQTPDAIEAVVRHGPLDDLRWLPIGLSLDPPEGVDVEGLCLRLSRHGDAWVRGNALTGLGHLARVTGELDPERVRPALKAGLKDDSGIVRVRAEDAISDVRIFLGWKLRQSGTRPRPRAPRKIPVVAAWRVWLIIDEDRNLLVERGAPDPRGLAPADAWRLPSHNLTQPPSEVAERMEALSDDRYRPEWPYETNLFHEHAVVRTARLEGGEGAAYGEWVQIRVRAWVTDRASSPWTAAKGVEQDWLSITDFMVKQQVGAADRLAFALFNDFYRDRTGGSFYR